MEPFRIYDYLVRSRTRVLDAARALSPEQHAQRFPIGCGSLIATLTHILGAEWCYIERLEGRALPPYDQCEFREEAPPPFAAIDEGWKRQTARTTAAIQRVRDWSAPVVYTVDRDDGRRFRIAATAGDLFTQLALHEVHHRAQALNILRHLSAPALGDLDFNTMMYSRQPV